MTTTENQDLPPILSLEYELARQVSTHIQPSNLPRSLQQFVLGAAKILFQSGNFGFVVLGDAGLATGTGSTTGSFSGGGFLMYDIGSRVTKGTDHFYIGIGGRSITITGASPSNPYLKSLSEKGFNKVYAR